MSQGYEVPITLKSMKSFENSKGTYLYQKRQKYWDDDPLGRVFKKVGLNHILSPPSIAQREFDEYQRLNRKRR